MSDDYDMPVKLALEPDWLERTIKDAQENSPEYHKARAEAAEAEREKLTVKLKEKHQQWCRLLAIINGDNPDGDGERSFCRDCADSDGRCCNDNLPCDPQKRAEELLATQKAKVKRLEEALRVFSKEADKYESLDGAHQDDENDTAWDSDFTVGDLRRARAALEG